MTKQIVITLFTVLGVFFTEAVTPPAGQTIGQPWPMPQTYQPTESTQMLSSDTFTFQVMGKTCDILEDAVTRYFRIIFYPSELVQTLKYKPFTARNAAAFYSFLMALDVELANDCEMYPSMGMDESYSISITSGSAKLSAAQIWGILRGLETFSQIVYQDENDNFVVNDTMITDAPRFSHRGILIDTSRHFITVPAIKDALEAMAYNKFNVFHWHIVDDESFPYMSRSFPDLSNKGGYDPHTHVYTQEDIAEIIKFSRKRGIRVVPEFDSPGHTQSWGKGQPDFLTKCYKSGQPTGGFGPVDPTLNTTWTFLQPFMNELTQVFKDKYIHLGGDEVSFSCWESNPDITKFMNKQGFGTNYSKLEQYYEQKLLNIMTELQHDYIIWQEVIDNDVKVRPDTVVEVWKSGYYQEMDKVTKLGYQTLLSSCWYLNYIKYGKDWNDFYKCDPQGFNGTAEQNKLVMGGEACIWGNYMDSTNLMPRLWPRASAVGERLWSSKSLIDPNAAQPRLQEQRCRMIRRGLRAEPVNGPGFCKYEFKYTIH